MRINPDPYSGLLSSLATSREKQNEAIQQLASGRRVSSISQDPAAWTMMIQNTSRSTANDEFLHSISSIQAMLNTADSTLSSVVTSLQRAVTLGVEGATGTQSADNRKAVATEVSGIRDQMLALANLSFNGVFVFSGTMTDAAPFKTDPAGTGSIQYQGNSIVNEIQIGENQSLKAGVAGDELFTKAGASVFGSLERLVSALNANDPEAISSATTEVRAAFDHVTSARVFYGNAVNQLASDETFLNNQKLLFAARENELVGIDPAEAATNVAQSQFAYSSTLAAAGKISLMSLLDYLK